MQEVSTQVLNELARSYALQQQASGKVPAPLDMRTDRPERLIARVLAAAPAPLTVDEINAVIRRFHPALGARLIRGVLDERPMFIRTGRRYWQFGRAPKMRR